MTSKDERSAEMEEKKKRHAESEAAQQKRHEATVLFRKYFLQVFTEQMAKNKE